MKPLRKLRVWWLYEARYYHKNFIYGIKNLIRWFPIIWKDRDWDDSYTWDIMIQKFKNQAKYIGTSNRHTHAKRDAEIMMTCVRLLERVKDEYYTGEYLDYYDFDFYFTDYKPGLKQLEVVDKWECYDMYFKKYPLVYNKVTKQDPDMDKKKIAIYMAYENHKRARKLLFNLMERNIEKWWD